MDEKTMKQIVDQAVPYRKEGYQVYAEIRVVEHSAVRLDANPGFRDQFEFERGWELIFVGSTDKVVEYRRWHDSRQERVTQTERFKLPVYVLGRKRDDVLQAALDKEEKVRSENYKLVSELDQARMNLADARDARDKLARKAERLTEDNERLEAERLAWSGTRCRLEKGLAEKDEEIAKLKDALARAATT